jgi:hypothetical protein
MPLREQRPQTARHQALIGLSRLPAAPADGRAIDRVADPRQRKLRYRGVANNDVWLHHRIAALNLRRILALGLTRRNGVWVLA